MLIKIGGATGGPTGARDATQGYGIHFHMQIAHKVEYIDPYFPFPPPDASSRWSLAPTTAGR